MSRLWVWWKLTAAFQFRDAGLLIWDSLGFLADAYLSSCFLRDNYRADGRWFYNCGDYIHTGFVALRHGTQILLNSLCNPVLNSAWQHRRIFIYLKYMNWPEKWSATNRLFTATFYWQDFENNINKHKISWPNYGHWPIQHMKSGSSANRFRIPYSNSDSS